MNTHNLVACIIYLITLGLFNHLLLIMHPTNGNELDIYHMNLIKQKAELLTLNNSAMDI